VLQAEIPDGSAIITGNFTPTEAADLAIKLKAGSLPVPVQVVEERRIDPTLGADAIAAGKRATIIGCLAVMIFMIGYYFLSGSWPTSPCAGTCCCCRWRSWLWARC